MEPVESTAAPVAEPVATAAEPAPPATPQAEAPAQPAAEPVPAQTAAEVSNSEAITTQPADNGAEENASSCTSGCNAGRNIGIAFVAIVFIVVVLRLIFRRKGGEAEGEDGQKTAAGGKAVEIYVGNLSYAMNDDQLRKEFERFGVVKSARVIGHRASGKSKGYGFVEMPHRKEAEIAIKNLNNRDVMGRKLRVNEARRGIPKE